MNGTKGDKRPIRAMAEIRENHGNEEISSGFPLAPSASAERNVQLTAKPRAQVDVPAAPEKPDDGWTRGELRVLRALEWSAQPAMCCAIQIMPPSLQEHPKNCRPGRTVVRSRDRGGS